MSSKSDETPDPTPNLEANPEENVIPRYSSAEEASMLAESNGLKTSANALFTISDYDGAISGYEKALAALPAYLDYEIAVLRSNIAACFVRLEEWKKAVDEADKGLQRLDEVEKSEGWTDGDEERVVEVTDEEEVAINERRYQREDVRRIRIKLLLRRAKARVETGTWAGLQGAQEGQFMSWCMLTVKLILGRLHTVKFFL